MGLQFWLSKCNMSASINLEELFSYKFVRIEHFYVYYHDSEEYINGNLAMDGVWHTCGPSCSCTGLSKLDLLLSWRRLGSDAIPFLLGIHILPGLGALYWSLTEFRVQCCIDIV